ncbi:MAG: hypothetical protein GY711_15695 [bacterium]|nr:hypothetical protein [bacterium]
MSSVASAQNTAFANWDYRIRAAPDAGPTELIRESERYGLGPVDRNNRITHHVWFYGTNDPNDPLADPLAQTPNETWTVHLVVDGPEPIPNAIVADDGPPDRNVDDIVLRDSSNAVIPFNATSNSYQIVFPPNTDDEDPQRIIHVDTTSPGALDGDAPIEEARLVIGDVTKDTAFSTWTVVPGPNVNSRYLFEDGDGGLGLAAWGRIARRSPVWAFPSAMKRFSPAFRLR